MTRSIGIARAAGALLALALGACGGSDDEPIGGPCTYAETPGTAQIVAVGAAPDDEHRCDDDPVQVLFDFVPDDPADLVHVAQLRALTVEAGAHPPRAWVEASGLTVGSVHPAVRSDALTGSCTPVVFELTDVDYAAGTAACFTP